MARRKVAEKSSSNLPLATSPEAQDNQMIALAVKLAERQLRDGTAAPSVITHYLKMASTREQLELETLRSKNKLLEAQTEAIESAKRIEELYAEAISAMRRYSGHAEEEYDEDEPY